MQYQRNNVSLLYSYFFGIIGFLCCTMIWLLLKYPQKTNNKYSKFSCFWIKCLLAKFDRLPVSVRRVLLHCPLKYHWYIPLYRFLHHPNRNRIHFPNYSLLLGQCVHRWCIFVVWFPIVFVVSIDDSQSRVWKADGVKIVQINEAVPKSNSEIRKKRHGKINQMPQKGGWVYIFNYKL